MTVISCAKHEKTHENILSYSSYFPLLPQSSFDSILLSIWDVHLHVAFFSLMHWCETLNRDASLWIRVWRSLWKRFRCKKDTYFISTASIFVNCSVPMDTTVHKWGQLYSFYCFTFHDVCRLWSHNYLWGDYEIQQRW